jgi:hypothetical protein
MLTLLGLAFYFAIEGMERALLGWHVSSRSLESGSF